MTILDHRGVPFPQKTKSFSSGGGGLLSALTASGQGTPEQRTNDAFSQHVWVYAAAMAIATNAGQAPWKIFRETDLQLEKRKTKSLKSLGHWRGAKSGSNRKAVVRHLSHSSSMKRVNKTGLEIDEEHPKNELFLKPNTHQTGSQLQQLTFLWLASKGECFWLMLSEDKNFATSADVTTLWPIDPGAMRNHYEYGTLGGDLVGFDMLTPSYLKAPGVPHVQFVPIDSVVHFKTPNNTSIVRGMSPMLPARASILLDMMIEEHTKNIFKNGAKLGGVLTTPMGLTVTDEADIQQKWKEVYQGTENAGKTAILHGDMKWQPTQMSPVDLQNIEQLRWNRDATLTSINVPKTVVGVTEALNYATQLGQDKNFWTKTLMPLMMMVEQTVDARIMFTEPDDIVASFDLSGIDALRVGLSESIESATQACGPQLRMPPRVAFELYGLDVPDYEGIDENFFATDPNFDEEDEEDDEEELDDEPEELEEDEEDEEDKEDEVKGLVNKSGGVKRKGWDEFLVLLNPIEENYGNRWKKWVRTEKKIALELFDDEAKSFSKNIDPTIVLPHIDSSKRRLRARVRPLYGTILESTYQFTLPEFGGPPIFQIDDETLTQYMTSRENVFVNNVPERVHKNLLKSLTEGVSNGESLPDLRKRIADIYDLNASDPKTLQIARTESASLINGIRDEMFVGQGFEELEWVDAGDEVVREDHVFFASLGPQPIGTNYMTLVGKPGELKHPGDPNAPTNQTIHCRCFRIPS